MSSSGPRLMASTDMASIFPSAKDTSLVVWLPLRSLTWNAIRWPTSDWLMLVLTTVSGAAAVSKWS